MSTTTLLIIIGGVVCVKTLAFVGFVMWRGRRQRVALDAATQAVAVAEAAVLQGEEPSRWRLQWSEPGVLLVENSSDAEAARDVEVAATLTAGSGVSASVHETVRFVGTGACFTASFARVDPWLTACTFTYSMSWCTPEGEWRCEAKDARSVVPVPDLALEPA